MLDDFTETSMNRREVPFGNNKMILVREDPFGFWSIGFERGAPPAKLKGQYTSLDEAYKDIKLYMAEKDPKAELKI